jgi:rSAM/selenodomain-associated transferase 2
VWRDLAALERLLVRHQPADDQWIVSRCDADPDEPALTALAGRFPSVRWVHGPKGRGLQQNAGAAMAAGAWLLFLHTDSTLPAGWRAEIERVASGGTHVWGCFSFGLDTDAWQARLIEWGVARRVQWWSLPYGDQGIFVRRDVFQSVGAFPPYPLMEDVALVRRLSRVGRPFRSPLVLKTSARRWQQDGWWRRSLRNLSVLTRYAVGVPPERLAGSYDKTQG